jgi:uncharacterized membrane protein
MTRAAAARLSRELRRGGGGWLRQRRRATALTLGAIGAMSVVSLHQIGLVRHLPEPPLSWLDADRIDGSPEAYSRFGVPDAVLGVASYAATLALVAMGGADRSVRQPWIPLLASAKAGFDTANAVRMTAVQWTRYRAFCGWCLLAAGATVATLPLVIGEARASWRTLRA